MNDKIKNHFEMKLLWKCKKVMDKKGKISEVYIQPERSKREDANIITYPMPEEVRKYL